MTARLVVSWVAFTVAAQAGLYWFLDEVAPGLYLDSDLTLVMSLLTAPAAQWGALRLAGVSWRGEWFAASLAGLVASSTLLNLLWSGLAGVSLPLQGPMLLIVSGLVEAVLQWVVLRAHVSRASVWFAGVAAGIVATLVMRSLMTGVTLPLELSHRPGARLAISATAALMQGLCLAWLLTSRRPDEVSLRSKPAWFVVEWTIAAAIAMVVIMTGLTVIGRVPGISQTQPMLLMPLLAGVVIGALQWMVLRRRLPVGGNWVVVSAAAMSVPALGVVMPVVMMYAVQLWFVTLSAPGGFAVIGAWMGAAQWLILRRHVAYAIVWVPACALAWSAWPLYGYGVSSTTIGMLAGVVTGIVMAVLLQHRKPAPAWARHVRARPVRQS
jgi:hypothetical protein